ncbi:MAG: GH92 family glycosyl hydrolase [Bacteroidaceae bacterium]|nr:GH92 family glycosyl hydrolase [Bacteroidaceae bacterium]
MRKILFALAMLLVGVSQSAMAQYVESVDPRIGSADHGHVFVGANVPWGMVNVGPVQPYHGWDWCSGYHATGDSIIGFAHTHLSGTGCSDLGDITIMPIYGYARTAGTREQFIEDIASRYTHEHEVVEPGYYSVRLDKWAIKAEMTATDRTAIHRFTFPKGNRYANIVLDLEGGVGDRVTETRVWAQDMFTLVGYRASRGWTNHIVYYAIRFDRPMKEFVLNNDDVNSHYAQVIFDVEPGTVIQVQVGISPVSEAGALANLQTEQYKKDFAQIKNEAKECWNRELGRIRAQFDSPRDSVIFYTSLYHVLFAPQVWNDVTGDYMGANGMLKRNSDFQNYTTWSLWDTYRTLHPLATLVMQDKLTDWAKTMMAICSEHGELPVWHLHSTDTYCMVGEPGVPVLADMILKGVPGFDYEKAFLYMKQSMGDPTFTPERRRFQYRGIPDRGKADLWKYGYIPFDGSEGETVSKNLEYYLAAWSVAQVAGKLGHKEDSVRYYNLSQGYKKIFDERALCFRAKDKAGNFRSLTGFNPSHHTPDYTEGTPWQYLWLVPHDVNGLVDLLGGQEKAAARLDSLFLADSRLNADANPDISGLIGQYAHGNEPSHHTIYIYNYLGQPQKTQKRIHEVFQTMYTDKPDGVCGNEDVGQMSAWYVMSAMGLYQVEPCGGIYQLTAPLVREASFNVSEDKTFTIRTKGKGTLVKRWKLNGKRLDRTYITHAEIMAGGVLEAELKK